MKEEREQEPIVRMCATCGEIAVPMCRGCAATWCRRRECFPNGDLHHAGCRNSKQGYFLRGGLGDAEEGDYIRFSGCFVSQTSRYRHPEMWSLTNGGSVESIGFLTRKWTEKKDENMVVMAVVSDPARREHAESATVFDPCVDGGFESSTELFRQVSEAFPMPHPNTEDSRSVLDGCT